MKILITGCCGFIGSNLSRRLLEEGHEIWGVDDLSVGNKEYLPLGMKFLEGRIDLDTFHSINLDLIIHLASRKIPREGNPDRVLRENALGIMKVVEMAQKHDTRIIYLSSSEVYGLNYKCSEDSHCLFSHPDNPRWSYGFSKLWSENYLFGSSGIRFNIIRLFATYGPYNCRHWRAGPIPVFIEQALNNEPFTIHGDGSQERCFQYIDDAIDGILRVIAYGMDREIFNIGNPGESTSIRLLAEKISDIISTERHGFITISSLNYINHFKNKKQWEDIKIRIPIITLAERKINFKPKISLDDGLRRTIKWHMQTRNWGENAG